MLACLKDRICVNKSSEYGISYQKVEDLGGTLRQIIILGSQTIAFIQNCIFIFKKLHEILKR
jgi:hypothetical protein